MFKCKDSQQLPDIQQKQKEGRKVGRKDGKKEGYGKCWGEKEVEQKRAGVGGQGKRNRRRIGGREGKRK